MINIVVELSKYVILTLMIIYTILCYYLVVKRIRQEGFTGPRFPLPFSGFHRVSGSILKTFDFRWQYFYAG